MMSSIQRLLTFMPMPVSRRTDVCDRGHLFRDRFRCNFFLGADVSGITIAKLYKKVNIIAKIWDPGSITIQNSFDEKTIVFAVGFRESGLFII